MSSFEEARHQGYSISDMATDIAEAEKRARDLGCFDCKWGETNSPTCEVIRNGVKVLCPYFKNREV